MRRLKRRPPTDLSWGPSTLFPATLNSHKQSTSPSTSRYLHGFALFHYKVSSWFRLVRIVTFIHRAVRLYRKSVNTPNIVFHCRHSSTEESQTQRPNFYSFHKRKIFSEIYAIEAKQPLPTNSHIKTSTPYNCPNGFLCAQDRLEKSRLDHDTKRPIILHGKHPISQLLILSTHRQEQHTRHVLQQTFWITSARSTNGLVITHCYDSRRKQAYGTQPQLSVLPEFRFPADRQCPFRAAGLDVFGPFASKTSNEYHKRYALF